METTEGHAHLKGRITGWLEDEGISWEEQSDLNSFFHISASLKNVLIHISGSKVRRGVLAVQGVASLSEEHLVKIQILKPEERKALFRSLFAILDKSEYLFLIQEDFASDAWLKIQRTVYVEDITRTSLLNEMKDLNTKFVNMNYAVSDALRPIASIETDKFPIYK